MTRFPWSLGRRVGSQIVDLVAGELLLHLFLWYRKHPPIAGRTRELLPELLSGDLHRIFQPEPMPVDLNSAVVRHWQDGDRRVEDLCFASEWTSPFPELNRVWCRRWHPVNDRKLVVIGCDGIVQIGTRWFRLLAERLAAQGIGVVMMDSAGNHRRVPQQYRPGQLILGGNVDHQLALARQSILDLWRVIRSVQAEGCRVGVVGCSYGGWLVLMSALLADDLEFAMALAPPVDFRALMEQPTPFTRALRRGLAVDPVSQREWEQAARAVSLTEWQPRLAGERIWLHWAAYDRFVPNEPIWRLARLWQAHLVRHDDAHYRITSRPEVRNQVAGQIEELWRSVPAVEPTTRSLLSGELR